MSARAACKRGTKNCKILDVYRLPVNQKILRCSRDLACANFDRLEIKKSKPTLRLYSSIARSSIYVYGCVCLKWASNQQTTLIRAARRQNAKEQSFACAHKKQRPKRKLKTFDRLAACFLLSQYLATKMQAKLVYMLFALVVAALAHTSTSSPVSAYHCSTTCNFDCRDLGLCFGKSSGGDVLKIMRVTFLQIIARISSVSAVRAAALTRSVCCHQPLDRQSLDRRISRARKSSCCQVNNSFNI